MDGNRDWKGGTIEFLNQAFGPGLITGGLKVLLWMSYFVMLSLYAYAFGSYAASFFLIDTQPFWLFDLSSIAIIFAAVNACNLHLYRKTASYRWISAFGVVVCVIALAALVWQTATISPKDLCVLAIMIGLAFAIEAIYRKFTGRVIRPLFKRGLWKSLKKMQSSLIKRLNQITQIKPRQARAAA